jgi:AmmeMemoRadiSam system protein B
MRRKNIRYRSLPGGWYPETSEKILGTINTWSGGKLPVSRENLVAAIVPHAGWAFSGKLAWKTISVFSGADTVIVVGGHMHEGSGILMAEEEEFQTPLGAISADLTFRDSLVEKVEGSAAVREDRSADNTVEVQLPLIRFCFPAAKLVWLRVGAGTEAIILGEAAAAAAKSSGKKTVLIGSTDLTHYGPAYSFEPAGSGEEAYLWVTEKNDRAVIEAMLDMNEQKVLNLAALNRSACSPGAAAAAISFARHMGAVSAEMAGYENSHGKSPGDSFVGYAGVRYGR